MLNRRATFFFGFFNFFQNFCEGLPKKYNVHNLVYYEKHNDVYGAITREKQMKMWKRQWKMRLIEKSNPDWVDLYEDLTA